MRKAVVAGLVGFGLLAGCAVNGHQDESQEYKRETAERRDAFRILCENDQSIKNKTTEIALCITRMDNQTPLKTKAPTKKSYSQRFEARIARARGAELKRIRQVCENDYGHIQGTPDFAQCIQQLDLERQRQSQEGMQALGEALSSMAPSTTTCNTTYGGGFARTNCY